MTSPYQISTRRRSLTSALVAILVAAAPLRAQDFSLADRWRWTSFDTEWGLPSNAVEDLRETDDGTPWARTTAGIAWYDGFRWHTMDASSGLPRGPVTRIEALDDQLAVLIDRTLYLGNADGFARVAFEGTPGDLPSWRGISSLADGDLALLSLGGKVFRWHPSRGLRVVGVPEGEENASSSAFISGTRGGAIFYNSGRGLFRMEGNRWTEWISAQGRGPLSVIAVDENEAGRGAALVEAPSEMRGVWSWGPGERPAYHASPGAMSDLVAVLDDGSIIAATPDASILRAGSKRWKTLDIPVPATAGWYFISPRGNGDVWVGQSGRLSLYRARTDVWETLTPPGDPIRARRVNDVAILADGSVAAATEAGLWLYGADGGWRNLIRDPDAPQGRLTTVEEDAEGRLWIGSGADFQGARVYSNGRWTQPAQPELSGMMVHRIQRSRDGRLWISALRPGFNPRDSLSRAVFVVREGVVTRWSPADSVSLGRIYAVSVPGDGSIWISGVGGLARYNAGKWQSWSIPNGLHTEAIFHVLARPDGSAWFVDRTDGVGRIGPDGAVRYYTTAHGLPSNEGWEIGETEGRIWVTTANGLALFDGESWTSIGTESGLSDRRVWPIATDGRRVVLGTLGGGVSVLHLDAVDPTPPRVETSTSGLGSENVEVSWTGYPPWAAEPLRALRFRMSFDGGPWSMWSSARRTEIPAPRWGKHSLEVEARRPLAPASHGRATLELTIPGPFWVRPAFIFPSGALVFVVFTVLLAGAVRIRRQERALAESQARYRGFFDDALTGNFIADEYWRIKNCNAALANSFGYEAPTALVGVDVRSFCLTEASARELEELLTRRGRVDRLAIDLSRKDGIRASVVLTLVRVPGASGTREIWGYVFDVTEQRELEHQLLAAQKMEAVGRLAGGIAHDFNNLLTAIYGFNALSSEDLGPDHPAQENLSQVRVAARRARDLTSQLLDFGRRSILEIQRVDLNAAILEVEPILRRTLGEDVALVIELEDGVGQVLVDPGRLTQIVMNLVVNARDAIPSGGQIRIATRTLDDEADTVCIEVHDDGRGIPASVLPHIFEPFYTTKEPGKGTGLGLSTVYAIAERFGGSVTVDSGPGRGTCFRVLIPTAPIPDGDGQTPPTRHDDAELAHVTADEPGRGRILVVEDDPRVLALIVKTLETAGYEVDPVEDGVAALDWVEAHGSAFDLVLTDVVMPRMGGVELVDRLRTRLGPFPVLMTSGYPGDHVETFSGRALDDLLPKPFTPKQLLLRVSELLSEKG
jgi:PAS domain S-box-containing protein